MNWCTDTSLVKGPGQYITFEDLMRAYEDCRRHKRRTVACSAFEQDVLHNLSGLLDELNHQTYEIGYSICFVVTRPKLREVYAADFRDRIVHHLIILKFNDILEDQFIPSSYNCRKGKGTLYGVKDMARKIDRVTEHGTREAWIWKGDLKNFFMSIDKPLLYRMLEALIRREYHGPDIEWWLWLIKKVVLHEPQNRRIVKGDGELLKQLPYGKTLEKNDPDHGVAIGNLPSQIFANFLLSMLDHLLYHYENNEYGRYVDDFMDINTCKAFLLWAMGVTRRYVEEVCHVRLHPDKWSLQQASKGVKFTGYVIKRGRIYMGNRTVNNAFSVVEKPRAGEMLETFVSRVNSYLGFMSHTESYAIRYRLWNAIPGNIKRYIYATDHLRKVVIREKYRKGDEWMKALARARRRHRRRVH